MAKVVTAIRSVIEKGLSVETVALITGGTSGIGAATARRMAELGAKVVITGRRQREGQLLVSDIRRNGGYAAFFQADLSQPDEARRVVPFTIETLGNWTDPTPVLFQHTPEIAWICCHGTLDATHGDRSGRQAAQGEDGI